MSEKSAIQWTGRRLGRIKQFCKKAGITVQEYQSKVACGLKWCTGCKEWHPTREFVIDNSRFDGLASVCSSRRNSLSRDSYSPKPRPLRGRKFVASRDDDRRQARRRINYLVEQHLIPHPNALPCFDCGHVYAMGERRHEYDHFAGYSAECHNKVQAVCSKCHKKRTNGKRK